MVRKFYFVSSLYIGNDNFKRIRLYQVETFQNGNMSQNQLKK